MKGLKVLFFFYFIFNIVVIIIFDLKRSQLFHLSQADSSLPVYIQALHQWQFVWRKSDHFVTFFSFPEIEFISNDSRF